METWSSRIQEASLRSSSFLISLFTRVSKDVLILKRRSKIEHDFEHSKRSLKHVAFAVLYHKKQTVKSFFSCNLRTLKESFKKMQAAICYDLKHFRFDLLTNLNNQHTRRFIKVSRNAIVTKVQLIFFFHATLNCASRQKYINLIPINMIVFKQVINAYLGWMEVSRIFIKLINFEMFAWVRIS